MSTRLRITPNGVINNQGEIDLPMNRSALHWPWPVLAGLVAAVLIVGVFSGVLLSQSHCAGYSQQLQDLGALSNQGKSDVVAGLADLYLANHDACPEAKAALASFSYRAAMQDLYRQQLPDGHSALL